MTEKNWRPASELPRNYGSYVLEPGMRVRTREGEEFLIGDVNTGGGACDCCRAVSVRVDDDQIQE